jgi:hypothetical protein
MGAGEHKFWGVLWAIGAFVAVVINVFFRDVDPALWLGAAIMSGIHFLRADVKEGRR